MIPYGTEISVMATRSRLDVRDGAGVVVVEVDAHAFSDFRLVLTPEQARILVDQLMRPAGRMEQAVRSSGRWLRRLTGRRA